MNVGEEVGGGLFATPEEFGGYVYVGEPSFNGAGVGWRW